MRGWTTQQTLKAKKGEMLFSRALGGLLEEAQHGRKTKKFLRIFFKISIVNISAPEPSIKNT
jgi:ribosomal protein L13